MTTRPEEEAREAELLGLHVDDGAMQNSYVGVGQLGGSFQGDPLKNQSSVDRQQRQPLINAPASRQLHQAGGVVGTGHENEVDYTDMISNTDYVMGMTGGDPVYHHGAMPSGTAEEQHPTDDAGYSFMPGRPVSGGTREQNVSALVDGLEHLQELDAELVELNEMTDDVGTQENGANNASKDVIEMEGKEVIAESYIDGEPSDSDEIDRRSIYVGNVDYGATPQELQDHFKTCGAVNRITIMVNKFTGHPKGYAYVEFSDAEAVSNAIVLSDTVFRGRQIKVDPKRKNIPGYAYSTRVSQRGKRGSFRGFQYEYPPFLAGRGAPPYLRGGGSQFGLRAAMTRSYGPRFRGRGRGARGPY